MEKVTNSDLKKIYLPPKGSHKGENGKLTIIGGSRLFHGASLWALKVASRIVDMVFYASVPENNELTKKLSGEIYDFIAVPRNEVEQYIKESDAVLIGPGMVRSDSSTSGEYFAHPRGVLTSKVSLSRILSLKNEGEQTYWLTKFLLQKYPQKKWIIDAGSLQMMEPSWLNKNCLITPHWGEFEKLFHTKRTHPNPLLRREGNLPLLKGEGGGEVMKMAKKYGCTILLKGETDIICGIDKNVSPPSLKLRRGEGGNAGMTKGGTGDVLAGLVAALACKNDLFTAACVASFINKKAGEKLFKKTGYYYNASDLADQIPQTMGNLLMRKAS